MLIVQQRQKTIAKHPERPDHRMEAGWVAGLEAASKRRRYLRYIRKKGQNGRRGGMGQSEVGSRRQRGRVLQQQRAQS